MGRTNATACYRELGAELKKRRDAKGLTGDDIARATGWHRSKVSRVELGQSEISLVDAIHYLGACKIFASDARELLALCAEAERQGGYWLNSHDDWVEDSISSLIYHEATAARSISYEPMLIPGLLQTQNYARGWIERSPGMSREAIGRAVIAREERQQVIHRPRPGHFVFYIHEQALRLRMGSDGVMQEQLLKLVLMAALPNVTVRVLPAAAGAGAMFGNSFRIFEYRHHQPLVYLDHPCGGLFLEDREFVAGYRRILPKVTSIALDEAESRVLMAELADALDRGSPKREAAIYELEEEQL